jgi:protein TonB
MLAHAGVAWLVSSGLLSNLAPLAKPDKVIMASVVMDAPAPSAPKPEPVKPQVKPHVKPQTVSPRVHPTPVLTPTLSSDASPLVPAAPYVPPTPAAPLTAGNQGPATNTTATAAAVVLPSTNADYLNNPAPTYPHQSKRLGEQGTVIIRVLITPEGRAEKAEIRTSSGYLRLDETALSTVQRWRFVPGQRNGVPEAMWFNVPIRFVLD